MIESPNIATRVAKAEKLVGSLVDLLEVDPEAAVQRARVLAETLLQWVFQDTLEREPSKHDRLEALLSTIQKETPKPIPDAIERHFRTVQREGNVASHPHAESGQLGLQATLPALNALLLTVEWYYTEHFKTSEHTQLQRLRRMLEPAAARSSLVPGLALAAVLVAILIGAQALVSSKELAEPTAQSQPVSKIDTPSKMPTEVKPVEGAPTKPPIVDSVANGMGKAKSQIAQQTPSAPDKSAASPQPTKNPTTGSPKQAEPPKPAVLLLEVELECRRPKEDGTFQALGDCSRVGMLKGDQLRFQVRANQDAYLTITSHNAGGRRQQVYPMNTSGIGARLKGNTPFKPIPELYGDKSKHWLEMDADKGVEDILTFSLSREPTKAQAPTNELAQLTHRGFVLPAQSTLPLPDMPQVQRLKATGQDQAKVTYRILRP